MLFAEYLTELETKKLSTQPVIDDARVFNCRMSTITNERQKDDCLNKSMQTLKSKDNV